jgi:cold shock CspA family protein/uncharacterized LabA/DUF88 family protein
MGAKLTDLVRIGIFYDGYYFYKVSNYYKYEHPRRARISINGLHDFIRNEAVKISGTEFKQCQIVDAHYFRGRSSAKGEMEKKIQSERIFEDILMRENIVTHYLPLKVGPDNVLQEKGIDVWLALEAYEMCIYKKFDIIALVVCDGDYVPLVRKLNTLGAHVMLISWEFDYYNENGKIESTRTSRQLLEEVYHPVLMGKVIDSEEQNEFTNNLFVLERENSFFADDATTYKPFAEIKPQIEGEENESFISTILTVKEGYGFIDDREVNNVFFHYGAVENMDFNDLKPGMQVRYYREEDAEMSKREEAPRYHATKVIVLG